MKKLRFILAVGIFTASELAVSDEIKLNNAVLSDGGISPRTELQKTATISVSSVLKAQGIDPYSAVASTNMNDNSIWYRLYKDLKIYAVDISAKKYVGNWQLTRWPVEADEINKKIYDMDMGSGFTEEQRWDKPHASGDQVTLGCLGVNPLRYGDINSDGKQELAVYLQDYTNQLDWIVFSPEKKSVIFSARLALQDYFPYPTPTATTEDNFAYQYASELKQRLGGIGIRAYAKIFIGDFDGNGKGDILVWRKRFHSLQMKDTKKGFALQLEAFNHYELVNGEYKKQPTDNAAIKNWLTAKQLTWQKGYPSKSECKGQEGQPIPESHDPSLNDPDVLK